MVREIYFKWYLTFLQFRYVLHNLKLFFISDRVSLNQSGSLSIFSSREQEYEQKAQLLKRLAYVIFCSEVDQYAKYMPDIQG